MKFTLNITNEMTNYLQRLGLEIDTRMSVISNMFEMHKDDTDTSVFDSVPWKKYYSELENVKNEYEIAKLKFGNEVLKPAIAEKIGYETNNFNWKIEDFSTNEVHIEVIE